MNITRWTKHLFFKLEFGNCEGRRIFRLTLTILPGKHEHRLINLSWNNRAMNESIARSIQNAKGA